MPELIDVVTSHTQDQSKIGTTRAFLTDYVQRNPNQEIPQISNEAGALLLGVNLPDIAAECFRVAFAGNDPYDYESTTYAGNFVAALAQSHQKIDADPDIRPWFPKNQRPLRITPRVENPWVL